MNRLVIPSKGCIFASVNQKWSNYLPYVLMAVTALSRWPGLFPPNFSVIYALAFCAGAFFPRNIKWWMPIGTILATDLVINLYYYFGLGINAFQWTQLINYAAFLAIILFGSCFNPRASFLWLFSGGLLGAILFYILTNTASWLFNPFNNPEYTKDLAGWLIALTKGTAGYPTTLEFFRNTLMSGGLFTGLFVGAMKLTESAESAREKETEEQKDEAPEGEEAPGEANA